VIAGKLGFCHIGTVHGDRMKIGELARMSGVAASRIRFYESTGLIEPAERRLNGYREYADEALLILEIINAGKRAGFSLNEIKAILPIRGRGWNHQTVVKSLEKKIVDIPSLQERLKRTKDDLRQLIAFIEVRPPRNGCVPSFSDAVGAIRSAKQRRSRSRARA
jgi:DNA-binding transcriptional MerR regulator